MTDMQLEIDLHVCVTVKYTKFEAYSLQSNKLGTMGIYQLISVYPCF